MQSLQSIQTNPAPNPATEAGVSRELAAELGRYTRPLEAMGSKLACGLPVLPSMPADLRHAANCLNGLALEMERIRREARP